MKKWMVVGLIGVLAGVTVAEDSMPWYKKMFTKNADEQTQVITPAPVATPVVAPATKKPTVKGNIGTVGEKQRPQLTPEQKEKMKARAEFNKPKEGAEVRQRIQNNPEQMEKIKAQHETLMKIGEAARNETDPTKKEVLVTQLREKLTEVADKMQAERKKRIEQADQEMPKLKERIADDEKNKATRVEEQVKRILAGEPLKAPEGKRQAEPRAGHLKKDAQAPTVQ